jgi:hypothetical protein
VKPNEADHFVRCRHRRNSGLVVEKREAQAQDLITSRKFSAKFLGWRSDMLLPVGPKRARTRM